MTGRAMLSRAQSMEVAVFLLLCGSCSIQPDNEQRDAAQV
jgi:hypothetical protein